MSEEMKRIIEVGGVKLEVDLRYAKRLDTFTVGQTIKVLQKSYGDQFTVKYGVIVDFGDFEKRPSIEILMIDPSSWERDPLQFIAVTAESKDIELAPVSEYDGMFAKEDILTKIERSISSAEQTLADLKWKRQMFLTKFDKYFKFDEVKEKIS